MASILLADAKIAVLMGITELRNGRFPNVPLGNAKTVGDGVRYQGFGNTLLIVASIPLADAKIAVLLGTETVGKSGINPPRGH
jgi:hypothetical protein